MKTPSTAFTGSAYALLADGTTAEIRPATPGDTAAVTAMHEAMSPENSYQRFFSFSRLSAEPEARRVCRAPAADHATLLATVDGQLAGVASYEIRGNGHEAEIAFAVADHMHGRGIGTLLLALFPHLYATIPGLFIIGFSAAAIIVPAQTLIAQETPPAMMGRVGSTVMSAVFSAQILGLILSGVLTEHISVRGVFALCTAMLVILTIIGKLWMEPDHHATPAA